ncbi:uncharacterized protein LOC123953862 [Meles meles]|uniref:uncharacterized protein LOC123953862 n=1 Tax=Meles meles TaxID=9662 RepID=UPI001E6A0471|nr:uncharacterized protein LOC123953862 [Meles meles]
MKQLMGQRGMKMPRDTILSPRSLRSLCPVRVPTMAWTVLLLGLLTYGSGADSQNVVTQEPSLTISLGGTVTLTCALSSGSVSTGHYPSWYQQTPGQPPRMIIYNTYSRPSGVPDRFSGSISGNKAALTITAAQPEDEADYYCVLYIGGYTNTVILISGEVQPEPPHGSKLLSLRGGREPPHIMLNQFHVPVYADSAVLSLSASLGSSARFTCTMSSVGTSALSLFQQQPGSPPEHLLR